MSENCIFCKIVRKEAPASHVYQDENVLAFLDINPASEGHVLVIPKQHYENIFKIPQNLIVSISGVVKKVATAVYQAVDADGVSIVQQNGTAAGQDIFHLHVHIIPRFGDNKPQNLKKRNLADREELEKVAKKIKRYL